MISRPTIYNLKPLHIGNALGSNGMYLSPCGRFDVDLDKRVDFEHLGPRKSVHYGYTQNDTWPHFRFEVQHPSSPQLGHNSNAAGCLVTVQLPRDCAH